MLDVYCPVSIKKKLTQTFIITINFTDVYFVTTWIKNLIPNLNYKIYKHEKKPSMVYKTRKHLVTAAAGEFTTHTKGF